MKTQLRSLTLTAVFYLAAAFSISAGPALAGNKSLEGQTLDPDAVKAVLLGKKATLGSDRVVIVVVKSSDVQEAFLKEYVGMTTDQFQTHWRRLFMSGGGTAPKVVETEAEACKVVAETKGAVSIVDSAKADGLVTLFSK